MVVWMFHVCSELRHDGEWEEYLRSGCSRSSNATHRRLCRIQVNHKYQCDACGEWRLGPLLWVCQHRRPRPDMHGLCLECASLALCEDRAEQAQPNLVAQNSHTVTITSLFCMKIAREVSVAVFAHCARGLCELRAREVSTLRDCAREVGIF